MVKRMLIDASHAEETRVVVASGTRLEEFDFETAAKKQLKGNFYLAKVMRVEPSLQAAFVEYGGNRHGFLPFGEIHPDYYQIPVADREALFAEQAAVDDNNNEEVQEESEQPAVEAPEKDAESGDEESGDIKGEETSKAKPSESVETLGGDDIDDEAQRRLHVSRSLLSRRYKIQEVIKKRQIMLIQVVKEERGNKGAALTTYLSLAGRYCVLMPNAVRGGGISRKIVNADDRKRLKAITNELKVPSRMAVIVRTAGLARTRAEIKRDFEYLLRQWEGIRKATLESSAPALINEEANLIRRSIRDLYSRDIDQILVEGDDGYRIAKNFMRTLIPSHGAKVQPYRDRIPLFTRYQVEGQLDAMYSAEVQLRSGGYLIISPTEALVSIDVNSGRATKQRNVEETAVKTNLEAADEIARQLRLRDLAGLVVIDFIDMDENRNQRNVERRFKEAMRSDRARIQIGRISPFGLLELSRQRLRPSILEAATEQCTVCQGAGVVRATTSSAVHVLRAVEEEGLRERSAEIRVHVPGNVALYILNNKRPVLSEIESRYHMKIAFEEDPTLIPPMYTIKTLATRDGAQVESNTAASGDEDGYSVSTEAEGEEQPRRRKRRRKQRGIKGGEEQDSVATPSNAEDADDEEGSGVATPPEEGEETNRGKRRRRGRRGGRRRGGRSREAENDTGEQAGNAASEVSGNTEEEDGATNSDESADEKMKPRRRSRSRRRRASAEKTETTASDESVGNEAAEASAEEIPVNKNSEPNLSPYPALGKEEPVTGHLEDSSEVSGDELVANPVDPEDDDVPDGVAGSDRPQEPPRRRSGWWQKVN